MFKFGIAVAPPSSCSTQGAGASYAYLKSEIHAGGHNELLIQFALPNRTWWTYNWNWTLARLIRYYGSTPLMHTQPITITITELVIHDDVHV